jgi:hypothetical protein
VNWQRPRSLGLEQHVDESGTIRVTHYSYLNDASEVNLLRDPLVATLQHRFKNIFRDRQRNGLKIRRALETSGGLVACAGDTAKDLAAGLYKVPFEGAGKNAFAEPFIASFCTHADRPYEREHGLLSQGRGYGGDGGFCIVFDTAELAKMLGTEFDAYYYVHLNMAPAIYADETATVEKLFPVLLDRCEYFLSGILDGRGVPPPIEDGFVPFVSGATCFRHQGFREEVEIRIVAIPGYQDLADLVRKEHPEIALSLIKAVDTDERGRRYVTLLDKATRPLPIKRIIVGPSRNQQRNVALAKALVGSSIPVEPSDTPFVG